MAKVMCRYSIGPQCELSIPKFDKELCSDVFSFRENPCPVFKPNRTDVCNPDCVHMVYPIHQFEGEYKTYELDGYDCTLTIGKRVIPLYAIHKLVIDGQEYEFECKGDNLIAIVCK